MWELDREIVIEVVIGFPPIIISFWVIFIDFICSDPPFMINYYEVLRSMFEKVRIIYSFTP